MKFNKQRGRAAAVAVALVTAATGLAACGGDSEGASDADTLNVLSWESYHDPAWVEEFTEETGIKVNIVNVGSPDEMFSKIKAAPSQWDLALVTSGWFDNYVNADLLEPIDEERVTALEDIKLGFDWRGAASSDDTLYGVLYSWGNQPLAWTDDAPLDDPALAQYLNEDGVPDDWNILWDPAFEGEVSVFDDPTSVLPMVPLSLGITDPYDLDEAEFEEVEDKLADLRPQLKRLTSGFNDQTDQFASGEASIGYLNNIASVTAVAETGTTLHVNNLVKQGVPAWSDNYAITKEGGAKKLDAVYEFINYTESLEWQARFVASSGNSGTLDYAQATSPEAQEAGLTEEKLNGTLIPFTQEGDAFFEKMLFFQPVEDLDRRVNLWNEFKLGLG
jgi:spermidine/putrescine-binding protein